MIWDDLGFLISKTKYSENSIICEIYTKCHGKTPGIIFGGTSKKIRNYLQLGNLLYLNYNTKTENRIGIFKTELQKAYSPIYFNNKKKLSCIILAMNLVKILTAESQKNADVFFLIEKFYNILNKDNWIKNYIFWELELFKLLGYHLEFDKLVEKEMKNDQFIYSTKFSNEKKIVPNFLVDKNNNKEEISILLDGLKLVGDFLEKSILRPNNLNLPLSRLYFINSLR